MIWDMETSEVAMSQEIREPRQMFKAQPRRQKIAAQRISSEAQRRAKHLTFGDFDEDEYDIETNADAIFAYWKNKPSAFFDKLHTMSPSQKKEVTLLFGLYAKAFQKRQNQRARWFSTMFEILKLSMECPQQQQEPGFCTFLSKYLIKGLRKGLITKEISLAALAKIIWGYIMEEQKSFLFWVSFGVTVINAAAAIVDFVEQYKCSSSGGKVAPAPTLPPVPLRAIPCD